MSSDAPVARGRRVIFSCGENDVTAGEVIDWAWITSELGSLWPEFLRAVECDRRANDEGLEPDDDGVDEAAVAFRYEYDLITAEETERWLADRGLTLTEFGDHFARQYWARNYSGEVPAPSQSDLAFAPAERDLFLVDLTLSGELDRLAEQMSFRLAALAEEGAIADTGAQREEFAAREGIQVLPGCLEKLGRDQSWRDRILAAELAFQRRRASIVNEKALARELQAMRLNLTRFKLETVEVDSRDAAAEVVACVRSDGMEMSEIAEESRYPFRCSEVLLEELPPDQQRSFLSIRAGALLEPIEREIGFEVCRVAHRVDPDLNDARIRARLSEEISRRHFSDLVSRHIDWKLLQPATQE